jgi:hypothetical protein
MKKFGTPICAGPGVEKENDGFAGVGWPSARRCLGDLGPACGFLEPALRLPERVLRLLGFRAGRFGDGALPRGRRDPGRLGFGRAGFEGEGVEGVVPGLVLLPPDGGGVAGQRPSRGRSVPSGHVKSGTLVGTLSCWPDAGSREGPMPTVSRPAVARLMSSFVLFIRAACLLPRSPWSALGTGRPYHGVPRPEPASY